MEHHMHEAHAPHHSNGSMQERDELFSEYGYDRELERGKIRAYGIHGRVLDAGTGHGHSLMQVLSVPGVQVVSVDSSKDKLDSVRTMIQEQMPEGAMGIMERLTFREGDLTSLSFREGEFDTVITSNTLHHIPEWRTAINELIRVCSDRIIIQEFTALGKRLMDRIIQEQDCDVSHKHQKDRIDIDAIATELEGRGKMTVHRGVISDIIVFRV